MTMNWGDERVGFASPHFKYIEYKILIEGCPDLFPSLKTKKHRCAWRIGASFAASGSQAAT
ncbi:hypothetical protein [Pandoraea aquatica]|uniref:hypothetical protein n=1 Tax=Pandoraea aquatica TaxID=2508290 RepID=UPI001242DA11|nr:hypothetical protein [Pandoraea aquatica]